MSLRHFQSFVYEHFLQRGVECSRSAFYVFVSHLVEVSVFDHHERCRVFQVAFPCCRHFQQSVAFDIFLHESGEHGMSYDGVPQFLVHVFPGSEFFEFVMVVRDNVVCSPAFDEVNDIWCPEVFFHSKNSFQNDHERGACLYPFFRV